MSDHTLNAIRRKLEAWELEHLRTLVSQQRDRIERLEDEVDILQQSADFWERHAHDLMRDVADMGETVGITKDGQVGIVKPDHPEPTLNRDLTFIGTTFEQPVDQSAINDWFAQLGTLSAPCKQKQFGATPLSSLLEELASSKQHDTPAKPNCQLHPDSAQPEPEASTSALSDSRCADQTVHSSSCVPPKSTHSTPES